MEKPRVLHVITRMDQGGSAIHTAWMVKLLDRNRYSSSFLCGSLDQLTPEEEHDLKSACEVFAIEPSLKRDPHPFYDFLALARLYKFYKKHNFDIIHTHTSKAGFIGRLAARLAGAKMVVHSPHGHIFYGYFGKLKTQMYIIMEKIAATNTDRMLVFTELAVQDHLDVGVGRKEMFRIVPSGVPLEKYLTPATPPEQVRENLGIPKGAKVIGGVARIDHVKGIRYLVEAFFILAKKRDNLYLIVAGEGDEREELTALIKEKGLENRAFLLGLRRDVPDLFHAMDIFVLPSLNEGYGKVVVEAMSAGRPVIASNVGGVRTIVEEGVTGLLIPPGKPEAIVNAVEKLLDNPELAAEMGSRGRNSVREERSVAAMIRNLDNIYADLLKEKGL